MSRSRLGFACIVGLLLAQTACPLEEDPKAVANCKIGSAECGSNTRIRYCDAQGHWGGWENFPCLTGDCQVLNNTPVCM